MEKVGLYIVNLLHDLTQMGYTVQFSDDFEGMITVTFGGKNTDWRDHQHIGYPGCDRVFLEKGIITCLSEFKAIKEQEAKNEAKK